MRVDGRLLLPAGAAWLGAAVARSALAMQPSLAARHDDAVRAGWITVAAIGALALSAVGAAAVLAAGGRGRRPRTLGALAGGWLPVVGVAVLAGLLGVLAACVNLAALTASPVAGWIDARATVRVEGIVTTEPRVRSLTRAAVWQEAQVTETRLATARVTARGTVVQVDMPVVVRLPPGPVPPPGSRVEVTGRLAPMTGQSDAAATLVARGIVVLSAPGPVDLVAHAMRSGLAAALAGTPPDAGSLVAGLAVGDESSQSAELDDDMRASGLSHLTAVSGGNVAIVLAVVVSIVVLLRLPLLVRVSAALVALAYFVVLVGPQPSVLRASTMGAVVTVGLLTGGRRAGPSVLGAGILLLVLLAPWLATSWAFALSAVATAGLVLLAPVIAGALQTWRRTRRWPPALREAVSLTAAAQLATLPVLVAMGGAVGWVALPANLLAMPVVPAVTVLGLLAAGLSPVLPGLAALVAHVAAWPAAWIALVAHAAAGLPWAAPSMPHGWWGLLALTAIAVVSGLLRRRMHVGAMSGPVRSAACIGLAACLVVLVALPPGRRGWPPEGWFLIMCDVGQGDALLVRSGEGAAVVIDAGPDPDAVDACLDDAGVVDVPALVLTHFHADHVRGLAGVLRGRSVAEVLVNPVRDPPEEADSVDRLLSDAAVPSGVISAGDVRTVGDVDWRAVWPRRRIDAGSVPNNASIVLVVTVSGHEVLLTGDVEPEAQVAIANDLRGREFDVVKIPHHGSRYQAPLLTSWAPAPVALISVGEGNDYGHPAAETIAAWQGIGALVARTDRDGDVAVVAAGTGVGVVSRRGMLPSS